MPTTRSSGRATRGVSPTANITPLEFAERQVDLDQPIIEEASDNSFSSPMADQRQTNNVHGSGGRPADEAVGERTITTDVQMEMLKALKETREGQEMMMSMMLEIQRQQEEMVSFRQQVMQIPTFRAMFPESSHGTRVGVGNNNENTQNVPPTTKTQQIPTITLEPHNSGDMPPSRIETDPLQPVIIPITLPLSSQVPIPTIPNHTQQPSPQVLHDTSVHHPTFPPHTPPMHQYITTPQRVHAPSHYVTKEDMIDVIDQFRRQTARPSELDFTPPYPTYIRRQPYPAGYIEHPPQFPKYNGEKGNAREHIAKFVESMSPWLGHDEVNNDNILLREFNKTLTDSAFSWYYNLEKGSVQNWDDMKLQFFKKFFYVQKHVTIVELMRIKQKLNEGLSDYVDRFRIQAQKCVEPIEEKNLVSICNNGALDIFKPHLITKACDSFTTLSLFSQDLGGIETLPDSHEIVAWKGKRTATVALPDSQLKPHGGKRERNDNVELPVSEAITCSKEAFKKLYEQWVEHGVVKPPRPKFMVTKEMERSSDFCMYHKCIGHPTMDCRKLRRIYHKKLAAGEIELE